MNSHITLIAVVDAPSPIASVPEDAMIYSRVSSGVSRSFFPWGTSYFAFHAVLQGTSSPEEDIAASVVYISPNYSEVYVILLCVVASFTPTFQIG